MSEKGRYHLRFKKIDDEHTETDKKESEEDEKHVFFIKSNIGHCLNNYIYLCVFALTSKLASDFDVISRELIS